MSTNKQALHTVLLIANALETAKQLRELAESPVAEAIFESIVENENGKEIQFERPISDLAFAAFLELEALAEALESAEKRNTELEAREVVLPKAISVLHRRDFIDAHRAIYAYPEAEVNAALAAAGITVKEDSE